MNTSYMNKVIDTVNTQGYMNEKSNDLMTTRDIRKDHTNLWQKCSVREQSETFREFARATA